MKKVVLFFAVSFLWNGLFAQGNKTWNGANGGLWSSAGNWIPSGMPGAADTVIFNSTNACDLNVNPVIAALRATGTGGNILSSAAARSMTIGNAGVVPSVLKIDAGSNLTLGNGGFGISISTYGTAGANTAQIAGNLNLLFASSWLVNDVGQTNITNADITGTINIPSFHTGAFLTNSNIATVRFLGGSSLAWSRNGGNIPAADYQNGSTINVTGVTNTMPAFSGAANYNGLLIWNSTTQNISGSSAVLLPTASYLMDSIRVVSTGTGSLRMTTEPAGYTLGNLEVQGGTVEMGAPLLGIGTANISNELNISGGTVYGNINNIGEVTENPMTINVFGNLVISGGTLNLTNRPVIAALFGACQVNVAGNVTQTGAGAITASYNYGSQNQLLLNGTAAQNLTLNTFSGPMALVIFNTSATGVTLLSNLTIPALPAALVLIDGVFYTTPANLLTMAAGSDVFGATNASFVDGPVKKIGNTDFTFPVGKTNCGLSANVNGYVPLAISNFTGSLATDAFTAEYKRGSLNLLNISNGGINHVSGCDYWTLTRDNGTPLVNITLSWDNPINNCLSTKPYIDELASLVVAHNNNVGASPWDALGSIGTFTGNTNTGTITWAGTQSGTFGAFTIASVNFNNPLPINLNYINGTKQGSSNWINWKVTCSNNNPSATMSLERSTDGRNFTSTITTITADALRCQQPFDHTDLNPAAGMNYYRLKMTDANGKISYSAMIGILNANTGFDIVNLLPNLVTSNAVLNVGSAQKTRMEVVIRDMAGKQLQKIQYNLAAGSNQFTMNLGNLSAGVYSITGYTTDGSSKTIRFVKN